jgi:hypothetical protein
MNINERLLGSAVVRNRKVLSTLEEVRVNVGSERHDHANKQKHSLAHQCVLADISQD